MAVQSPVATPPQHPPHTPARHPSPNSHHPHPTAACLDYVVYATRRQHGQVRVALHAVGHVVVRLQHPAGTKGPGQQQRCCGVGIGGEGAQKAANEEESSSKTQCRCPVPPCKPLPATARHTLARPLAPLCAHPLHPPCPQTPFLLPPTPSPPIQPLQPCPCDNPAPDALPCVGVKNEHAPIVAAARHQLILRACKEAAAKGGLYGMRGGQLFLSCAYWRLRLLGGKACFQPGQALMGAWIPMLRHSAAQHSRALRMTGSTQEGGLLDVCLHVTLPNVALQGKSERRGAWVHEWGGLEWVGWAPRHEHGAAQGTCRDCSWCRTQRASTEMRHSIAAAPPGHAPGQALCSMGRASRQATRHLGLPALPRPCLPAAPAACACRPQKRSIGRAAAGRAAARGGAL